MTIIGVIVGIFMVVFVITMLVLNKMGKLVVDDPNIEDGESAFYEPSQEEINQLSDNLYTLSVQDERAFSSRSIQDVLSMALLRVPHARIDEQYFIFRNDPHVADATVCICTLVKDTVDYQVMVELAANQTEFAVIRKRVVEELATKAERQTNVQ